MMLTEATRLRKDSMKKRQNRIPSTTRLDPENQESLDILINLTGWNVNKAMNTIVSAGFAQLQTSPDAKLDSIQVKNIRELIKAAATTHQIELGSQETVRKARRTVRHLEAKVRANKRSYKERTKSR
jgi:hypothetical protein